MISKHLAVFNWIQTFTDMDLGNMQFALIERESGARSMVPVYSDNVIRTNIIGQKTKEYMFAFIGIETVDTTATTTINQENMDLYDKFNEWIEEQNENDTFPDFGDNVQFLKVEPLQNMANGVQYDEGTQTMKYMLQLKITYREV